MALGIFCRNRRRTSLIRHRPVINPGAGLTYRASGSCRDSRYRRVKPPVINAPFTSRNPGKVNESSCVVKRSTAWPRCGSTASGWANISAVLRLLNWISQRPPVSVRRISLPWPYKTTLWRTKSPRLPAMPAMPWAASVGRSPYLPCRKLMYAPGRYARALIRTTRMPRSI